MTSWHSRDERSREEGGIGTRIGRDEESEETRRVYDYVCDKNCCIGLYVKGLGLRFMHSARRCLKVRNKNAGSSEPCEYPASNES